MIDAGVQIDKADVERALGLTLAKKAGLVMARASNRSITTGKSVLKKATAEKYMVRQKDVEKVLKVTKATSDKPSVILTFKDDRKNLFYWTKRQRGVVAPNVPISYDGDGSPLPKVYAAHVTRSRGLVELGGKRKPFVQIAKKSGNMALFRRVSNHSREIEGVAGPALPQIVGNKEVLHKFESKTSEMLLKRLNHEIDYELSKGV